MHGAAITQRKGQWDTLQPLIEAIGNIQGPLLKKVPSVHMTKVLFKLFERDRGKQHI